MLKVKNNQRQKWIKNLCFVLIVLTINSCLMDKSPKKFNDLTKDSTVKAKDIITDLNIKYCPTKATETKSIAFLDLSFDFSGSNKKRSTCFIGTDMEAKRLIEAKKFIQSQKVTDKNILYVAIETWSTAAADQCRLFFNGRTKSYIRYDLTDKDDIADENHPVFDVLNGLIDDAINGTGYLDAACKDGWTNYLQALDSLSKTKKEFVDEMRQIYYEGSPEAANITFYSIFLSDGIPKAPAPGGNPIIQDKYEILGKAYDYIYLNNLTDKSNIDSITTFLNTAFYTKAFDLLPGMGGGSCTIPNEPDPKDLLKNMATVGNGVFKDLNDNINFGNFALQTLYNGFKTNRVIVFDMSSVWILNELGIAEYAQDADGDALADEEELELGSDPKDADSDNDGIRDGVEMRISGSPTSFNYNGPYDINDTDNDGITNMEEVVLGLDYAVSDINNNGFPDWMDFVNKIALSSTNTTLDADGDGFSNQEEQEGTLPLNINNIYLSKDLKKQTYSISDATAKDACRDATISNFRLSSKTEPAKIKLWYYAIQDQGLKKQLVSGEMTINPGKETNIIFTDGPESTVTNLRTYHEGKK